MMALLWLPMRNRVIVALDAAVLLVVAFGAPGCSPGFSTCSGSAWSSCWWYGGPTPRRFVARLPVLLCHRWCRCPLR